MNLQVEKLFTDKIALGMSILGFFGAVLEDTFGCFDSKSIRGTVTSSSLAIKDRFRSILTGAEHDHLDTWERFVGVNMYGTMMLFMLFQIATFVCVLIPLNPYPTFSVYFVTSLILLGYLSWFCAVSIAYVKLNKVASKATERCDD